MALLAVVVASLPSASFAATISEAKRLGDGNSVTLTDKVVTYVSTDFFYIQEPNSVSLSDAPVGGIRVNRTAHGLAVGACVGVSGVMRTSTKLERYVECLSAPTLSGSGTVVPWAISNKAVGGSDWNYDSATNAGQRGIDQKGGLNNVGLLVRTSGFVIHVDSAGLFAYIDDGSSLYDGNTAGPVGTPISGLRVIFASSASLPKTTQYITVTGISCLETVAGLPARAILATATVRDDPVTLMSDMNMLCVPAGPFLMGNSGTGDDATWGYAREYPQHPVDVPTFWISKNEVTRGQYSQFMSAGGYSKSAYWSGPGWSWKLSVNRTQPDYWGTSATWWDWIRPDTSLNSFTQTSNHPVVGVTYYEAEAFCKWAGGRLPTEAEWEKAARWDGTPRIYPWGNTMDKTKSNSWYDTTYPGFQTSPVASYSTAAGPYGNLDMAGNAWEWTSDWYTSYPGSSTPFDKTGAARALRGGGWYGTYGARCASRWFCAPGSTDNDIGFRLAR